MSKIVETYEARTQKSKDVQARAVNSIVGGNSRGAANWRPYPTTLAKAQGVTLTDVDGNEYLDLVNNFTSLAHGNAYPPVVEAATRQIGLGTAWSSNNEFQPALAELLIERIPSVESVRFVNSGSEAGALALNIARANTGRNKVLMARFGYHGILSEFEHGTTSGFILPNFDQTILGEYGDAESFEKILDERGSEIAAVILEPVMGAGGIRVAPAEFYQRVCQATKKAGAVFVCDEVIAFRMAPGGTQTLHGIDPDLTMLGKVIGGGFPVGAVGGKLELMRCMDAARLRDPDAPKLLHSGTFAANPVTMAAGLISVRDLTAERIDAMAVLCERLLGHFHAGAQKAGLPYTVNSMGSLANIFFSDTAPRSPLVRKDEKAIGLFHLAALNHGLMFAGRGLCVLSTIMDEKLIDEVGERTAAAMADVAAEL